MLANEFFFIQHFYFIGFIYFFFVVSISESWTNGNCASCREVQAMQNDEERSNKYEKKNEFWKETLHVLLICKSIEIHLKPFQITGKTLSEYFLLRFHKSLASSVKINKFLQPLTQTHAFPYYAHFDKFKLQMRMIQCNWQRYVSSLNSGKNDKR